MIRNADRISIHRNDDMTLDEARNAVRVLVEMIGEG
jgi:hypothetical protein